MRSGDERAFDEFFGAYFPRLFHFAVRRLGNEDAAEDVVQAALVVAMRKIGTWRGEAALFTWLCTICRHKLSAYWTRTGRQPVTLPLDNHPDQIACFSYPLTEQAGPEWSRRWVRTHRGGRIMRKQVLVIAFLLAAGIDASAQEFTGSIY